MSVSVRLHFVCTASWLLASFCTGWRIHKNYLLMNYSFSFEWAYATSKWKWPQLSLFDCIYLLYLALFCHGSLLFWFKFVLQRKIKKSNVEVAVEQKKNVFILFNWLRFMFIFEHVPTSLNHIQLFFPVFHCLSPSSNRSYFTLLE